MAGRFIEEFTRSMGWTANRGTACGIFMGYLFTVKEYDGYTHTNVWLYTRGNVNSMKLEEWFLQAKNEYKIAQIPQFAAARIRIAQHLASPAEVKGMIEAFAGWLSAEGAKPGCEKCGSMDENALSFIDGVPVYQCPACGWKTIPGNEPGATPKPSSAEPTVYQDGPEGIGGWLAVFLIARFLGILIILIGIFSIASGQIAHALTATGHGYIITLAVLLDIINIAFEVAIIALMLKKMILFRMLFVIFSSFGVVIAIVIPILMSSILHISFQMSPSLVGSIAGTVIWSIYLFASRRVENTFTRFEKKPKIDMR